MMGKIFYSQASMSVTGKSKEYNKLWEKVASCANALQQHFSVMVLSRVTKY